MINRVIRLCMFQKWPFFLLKRIIGSFYRRLIITFYQLSDLTLLVVGQTLLSWASFGSSKIIGTRHLCQESEQYVWFAITFLSYCYSFLLLSASKKSGIWCCFEIEFLKLSSALRATVEIWNLSFYLIIT